MVKKVVVIGGGPCGLAASYELVKRHGDGDVQVVLLEKENRIGGWLKTTEGVMLSEQGPRAFKSSGPGGYTLQLACELGIKNELIPAERSAAKRFIYIDDSLQQVTLWWVLRRIGLRQLFLEFMNWTPAAADRSTETISEFFKRKFGESMQVVSQCVVGGVFAGDASRLSVADAFPAIAAMEENCGSLLWCGLKSFFGFYKPPSPVPITDEIAALQTKSMYNFKRGMQTLPAALLKGLGDKVTVKRNSLVVGLGSNPTSVRLVTGEVIECDHIICTIAPYFLSPLVSKLCTEKPVLAELPGLLGSIPHADLTLVNIMGNEDCVSVSKKLRSFGFLVPNGEILGATMDSYTFPQQYEGVEYKGKQAVAITVMIGGELKTKAWLKGIDAPVVAAAALEKYAGIIVDLKESLVTTTCTKHAIPQFNSGHRARMDKITTALLPHNISLAGMCTIGIGVNDCLLSGLRAVQSLEATDFFKTA
eukprot:TRINITY_DN1051_c1_g3_i1.p1 TRINITY_DN1051_c1_g3~~TRINITY_DN1051_c1_g3_i1.p1  ORF type:complete len:477 (+),score=136.08 TRINITY_DN1051_c1_g3_i1:60-1490(+)